jgi:hypothetical protein
MPLDGSRGVAVTGDVLPKHLPKFELVAYEDPGVVRGCRGTALRAK